MNKITQSDAWTYAQISRYHWRTVHTDGCPSCPGDTATQQADRNHVVLCITCSWVYPVSNPTYGDAP